MFNIKKSLLVFFQMIMATGCFAQDTIPKWLVPNPIIEDSQEVSIYLKIPSSDGKEISIGLLQPSNIRVHFSHGIKALELKVKKITNDTIIPIKVYAEKSGSYQLIAVVKTMIEKKGISSKNAITTLNVKDNTLELPPFWTSLIATTFGFVGGFLTQWATNRLNTIAERGKKRREVELQFITTVLKEIISHKIIYNKLLDKNYSSQDSLQLKEYLQLLSEKGILLSPSTDSFKKYFQNIENYYKGVNHVNTAMYAFFPKQDDTSLERRLHELVRNQLAKLENLKIE